MPGAGIALEPHLGRPKGIGNHIIRSYIVNVFITCNSNHFGSHRSLPEVAGEVTLGAVFVELAVVLSLSGSSGIRYRLVHGHVTIIPFIVRFVVAENLSDSNWLSICKI